MKFKRKNVIHFTTISLSSVLSCGVIIGALNSSISSSSLFSENGLNGNKGASLADGKEWLSANDKKYLDYFSNIFASNDINKIVDSLNKDSLNVSRSAEDLVNQFAKTAENVPDSVTSKNDYIAKRDISGLTYKSLNNKNLSFTVNLTKDRTSTKLYVDNKTNKSIDIPTNTESLDFNLDLKGNKIYFYNDDILGKDFNGVFNINKDLIGYSLVAGLYKDSDFKYRLCFSPMVKKNDSISYLNSEMSLNANNKLLSTFADKKDWYLTFELNIKPNDNISDSINQSDVNESKLLKKFDNLLHDKDNNLNKIFNNLKSEVFTTQYSNESKKLFADSIIKSNWRTYDDFSDKEHITWKDLLTNKDILGVEDINSDNQGNLLIDVKLSQFSLEHSGILAYDNGVLSGVEIFTPDIQTKLLTQNKPLLFLSDTVYPSKYELKIHKIEDPSKYSAVVGIYKERNKYYLGITNYYSSINGSIEKLDSQIEYDVNKKGNTFNKFVSNNVDFRIPLNFTNDANTDNGWNNTLVEISSILNGKFSLATKADWLNQQYSDLTDQEKHDIALQLVKTKFSTREDKTTTGPVYVRVYPSGLSLSDVTDSLYKNNEIQTIKSITANNDGGLSFLITLSRPDGHIINNAAFNFFNMHTEVAEYVKGNELTISINPKDTSKGFEFINSSAFKSPEEFYKHIDDNNLENSGIFLGLIADGKSKYISLYSKDAWISVNRYDLLSAKYGIKVDKLVYYK